MTEILWLLPNTPDSVSVGRQEIAQRLMAQGYSVYQKQAQPSDLKSLHEYDCIIGTTRRGALLGQLGITVPLIVDHVDPISQFYETQGGTLARLVDLGERVAFKRAKEVLYVNPEDEHRIPESKASQTTLGVPYQAFNDPPKHIVNCARKQVEHVGQDFAIYIGALEDRYNLDMMLASVDKLDRELVIAGDGTRRDDVQVASERIENLHYLGSLDYTIIPGLLSLASVGLCLVDDPYTCKVLEYGAAGLGVVHLSGKAESELPSDVEFVSHSEQIPQAVKRATPSDALDAYAKGRDYQVVTGDYRRAIERTVG